jgi:hypothetical protein
VMLKLLNVGVEFPLGKNKVLVLNGEERASRGGYPHRSVVTKTASIDSTAFCVAGDFNLRVVLTFVDSIEVGVKVASGAVPNISFDLNVFVPNGSMVRKITT